MQAELILMKTLSAGMACWVKQPDEAGPLIPSRIVSIRGDVIMVQMFNTELKTPLMVAEEQLVPNPYQVWPHETGRWVQYNGYRYKVPHNVKLISGEEINNCIPNAVYWQTPDNMTIHDDEVAFIQIPVGTEVTDFYTQRLQGVLDNHLKSLILKDLL